MRIISGLARGRKLLSPGQVETIRPTADRAKEALFSIIGNRIVSARVLDLYCGTGALGLEAFSRGASQVVFVDFQQKALEITRKNFITCFQNIIKIQSDEISILHHDLRRGLNFKKGAVPLPECFDFIFLDPPYGKNLSVNTLQDINNSTLYTSDSVIVAEETSNAILPDSFSRLILEDRRRYGDSSFWFYKVKRTHGT